MEGLTDALTTGGREHRSAIALLLTFTLALPLVTWNIAHTQNYHVSLNPAVMSLVGGVDEGLASRISFDAKNQVYVFNADGKKKQNPAPSDTYSLTVGADKSNPASTYSVDLPVDPRLGFTYYSNHLQLSFTLIPQFPMGPAQETQGRIVYPLENGGEAIYTVKNNGLREDLVFTQPTTTANFTYQLKLPDTLQAQNKDGLIGIYSADPSLFGNITFGSSDDQTKVMQARTNSAKTNLVFGIAQPVVKDIRGGTSNQVNYSLSGDQLQVSANGLSSLSYPITIDPSIVVTSTADFVNGNNEGDIDFGTNQLNRGQTTGGVLGAWAATASLPVATQTAASATYNGYLYEIGNNGPTAAVYYAPFNTNGTLGAWTATTSLLVAENQLTAVAYNGYLYEISGQMSAAVYYAPINADGSIGAWAATSGFAVATALSTSVVYNGYVYEIGGCAAACPTTIVDYALIHADGTLGAWTATTALPVATYDSASVAYNGYLYEIGGCATACPTTAVYYAPINANGTIGAWTATAALPVATFVHTAVVYNGYIYELGGCASSCGTPTGIVRYAQINANGTLGAWTATTSLSATVYSATSVAYNGYIYEIGGCSTACATTVVDYAQIKPAGWLGTGNPTAWTATSSLPVPNDLGFAVAYNGYLYELGGYNYDTGIASSAVRYAQINANGTINAWGTTTALPPTNGIYYLSSVVVYNGYLYELGGYDAALGPTAIVRYALINANGTIGAWTATTSLPATNYLGSAVVYNGYVYEIGGCSTACPTNVVDYAPIAANGTIGAWTATTGGAILPAANWYATSVVYNGYVYEIGGNTGAATAVVDYAQINANGTLGAWTATTSLPAATYSSGSVAYNGYLYEVGGCAAACPSNVVDYAPIHANGTIGAWVATTPFITAVQGDNAVAYNGYLYEIGGCTGCGGAGSTSAAVDYALINNGGPGTVGAWSTTTILPAVIDAATSVAYNGYVYQLGGFGATLPTNATYYAAINPITGALGAWTATTVLPDTDYGATSVVYNGYLYEIGGSWGLSTKAVVYSLISGTGTLGAWTATTDLPALNNGATSVVYNGYLYEIGGAWGGTPTTVVDYAPIQATGALGAWTATTALPTATYHATSVAYNGYVYEIGGNLGGPDTAVVEYAPFNTDGTLGAWTATTRLLGNNLNAGGTGGDWGATSVVLNGYLYEIAGVRNNGYSSTEVDYAPINASGTIGAWTVTTSLPQTDNSATSVVYNGYVYVMGGCAAVLCPSTATWYAPLNSIPRTGEYSKMFNEGASGGVTSWNANSNSLLHATYGATSVAYNGYIYEIGGCGTPCPTTEVDYATIGEDGTIGAWTATTSLPTTTYLATSVVYNGYIYEIGGCTAFLCPSNGTTTVDYVAINANGTLATPWQATTALLAGTYYATSVAYNGYLYEIGGSAPGSVATVDYVAINANGTLATPWQATTSLLVATTQATSVVSNGYLYEIGGCCSSAVVDYVAINSNGTLATPWQATTSLPAGTTTATSVVYNGYIYEIGGNASGYTAAVLFAPINANGTIGAWNGTVRLPVATQQATSVVYNGYVYEIGGNTGSSTAVVDYAPIRYSIPIGTLVSIQYQGILPGGLSSISFETASSTGILTASALAPTVTQVNCVSGSIQYIWVRIKLDDSIDGGAGVFPDIYGPNTANLTSFTINYMSHPPAGAWLYGDQFFSNNVLSPLDTCHP